MKNKQKNESADAEQQRKIDLISEFTNSISDNRKHLEFTRDENDKCVVKFQCSAESLFFCIDLLEKHASELCGPPPKIKISKKGSSGYLLPSQTEYWIAAKYFYKVDGYRYTDAINDLLKLWDPNNNESIEKLQQRAKRMLKENKKNIMQEREISARFVRIFKKYKSDQKSSPSDSNASPTK